MSYSNKQRKRYIIGAFKDFKSVKDAVAWLVTGSNMTAPVELFCDSGSEIITDTIAINLPYHLQIRSYDFNCFTFQAGTGLTIYL